MNFLVTNDDGITAPGLWELVRCLQNLGHVLVVAPNVNYSGFGAALPPARELYFQTYRHEDRGLQSVPAYALHAPPATCVQVGLSRVLSNRRVDFVVSGINDGVNLGRDVLYSGTVGAAITAYLLGVDAIAVSLDTARTGVAHWNSAAWAVQEVIGSRSGHWAGPSLHNLNVPNLPIGELAGIQLTRLSTKTCLADYSIVRLSENTLVPARTTLASAGVPEPGTDGWAVAHQYVSNTPLRLFEDQLQAAAWSALFAEEPGVPAPSAASA